MKYVTIFLLWLCLFTASYTVAAKQPISTMSELDQIADEALQLTRFGRFAEAKGLIAQFGKLFAEQGVTEKTFTIDELRVLTTSQNEALEAVTSASMNKDDRIKKVTAFRLATDAVISKYQPMWLDMESQILQSFQQVKNAALDGDNVLYNQALNEFLSTYSVIQPSLKIDMSVENVQKLDSKMTYLDKYRSKFSEQEWANELDTIETDLKQLFEQISQDEIDPSVWWVIIMTSSIIITTLSYVSWKKYRGQKQKKSRRDANR
ncbi:sporulation protein YpjB [Lederbergia lenta]|uniref:Sporulation protein YpjB n=1 Tax=Lederbergia lenta TaxID=1467 RepID=A0A2X4VX28_LEDLE|nr:sporulation protein YpjB [Lederbergia lenta]MCM3109285.1 sporulation protein YpjB [Lederbergia lenta]MEC2324950.1 sporulation protein YpjB [Lederbergia lenta]SQI56556.1 sporulation protein YpjB [Lederbergia lenta]